MVESRVRTWEEMVGRPHLGDQHARLFRPRFSIGTRARFLNASCAGSNPAEGAKRKCLVMRLATQPRCLRGETGSIPVRGASGRATRALAGGACSPYAPAMSGLTPTETARYARKLSFHGRPTFDSSGA